MLSLEFGEMAEEIKKRIWPSLVKLYLVGEHDCSRVLISVDPGNWCCQCFEVTYLWLSGSSGSQVALCHSYSASGWNIDQFWRTVHQCWPQCLSELLCLVAPGKMPNYNCQPGDYQLSEGLWKCATSQWWLQIYCYQGFFISWIAHLEYLGPHGRREEEVHPATLDDAVQGHIIRTLFFDQTRRRWCYHQAPIWKKDNVDYVLC